MLLQFLLVISKANDIVFAYIGKVSTKSLVDYLSSDIEYKKIILTYDMLPKVLEVIDPSHWTLLIDEYHLLFNDCNSFR